jgi:hypothetical protein
LLRYSLFSARTIFSTCFPHVLGLFNKGGLAGTTLFHTSAVQKRSLLGFAASHQLHGPMPPGSIGGNAGDGAMGGDGGGEKARKPQS